VRWFVLPELRDCLLGANGLRLDDWLRDGAARIVKHGPHQSVYHVRLDGLDFHLKQYHVGNVRAWMRSLLRPAKARMECDRALALVQRGLPTFTPIALGECDSSGSSFLLTRTLENTRTLADFLEITLPTMAEPRRTRLRIRLAGALGRFVAQMHDAGVVHHDFHAGNLLVRLLDNDHFEIFLIDLHAVRLGPPLGWKARRANLVVLNRWFVLRSDRTDRRRFWYAYHAASDPKLSTLPRHPEEARTLARDLEEATWRSNLAFWANRDRRCLTTNRYYERLHGPAADGIAVRDLAPDVVRSLLTDPDGPFLRDDARFLKDSRSTTLVEFEANLGGTRRMLVYKRFRLRAWHEPWTTLARLSAAMRSWVFGHGLRERWLPTPRPLLILHRRRCGLSAEGYLLAEKIEDAGDLHDFAAFVRRLPATQQQPVLRRRLEAVARLIRELHRRLLSHRDLKATNLLTRLEGNRSASSFCPRGDASIAAPVSPPMDGDDVVWLIDLVGMTRRTRLTRLRKVRDLARLHASFVHDPLLSRSNKLRFLRVYLQFGLFGKSEWKSWWRDIDAATQAKVERNRRLGRPLW
jgi:tRNA A-37 threonylcarbamoyl transferase component Bud32